MIKTAAVPSLDADAWALWLRYRKSIKKPINDFSVPYAQKKLASFGRSQMKVVEQSITNSWQGLFALRDDGNVDVSTFDASAPW